MNNERCQMMSCARWVAICLYWGLAIVGLVLIATH